MMTMFLSRKEKIEINIKLDNIYNALTDTDENKNRTNKLDTVSNKLDKLDKLDSIEDILKEIRDKLEKK